jgi:hypothetical protein
LHYSQYQYIIRGGGWQAFTLGFLAEHVAEDPQPCPESPGVGWLPRERVLAMITHLTLHDRARDVLEFEGRVVRRACATDPYEVYGERLL